MASYQNTNGYYCGMTASIHPERCSNPNVHCNQINTNFQTFQNYSQAVYPGTSSVGSFYNSTHGQMIHNVGNVYGHTPQVTFQYSSLAPVPVPYPVFHQEQKPQYNNQYMAKRHCAHITILPTSKGTFKANNKRKRKRTIFTTEQVEALEDIFKRKQYVNREERLVIVNQLQRSDKAVKIWFQNRRLKVKRVQNENIEDQAESSNEERSSSVLTTLNSVEYRISQKTDERGFVLLDDGVINDLVDVIDDVFTNNNLEAPVEEIVGSENSSLYEPISPASVSDGNEDVNSVNWRPCEPNESLRILFDLQDMYNL